MARSKQEQELFDLLRAKGLRKRVARTVAEAASKADGTMPKAVRDALGDLRSVASEIEGRVTGKSKQQSQAAKKAAQTRKRNATKRSQAAKKAASTRAKSGSGSRSSGSSRSKASRSAAAKKGARTRAAKSR